MYLQDIKCLGKEGQDEAWLCNDLKTGQLLVAKKTKEVQGIRRDGNPDEVTILSQILGQHPNICHLKAF